jgi:hypothetical protein
MVGCAKAFCENNIARKKQDTIALLILVFRIWMGSFMNGLVSDFGFE